MTFLDKGFWTAGAVLPGHRPCREQTSPSYSVSQSLLNIWLMPDTVLSGVGRKSIHTWPLFFRNPLSDWDTSERILLGKMCFLAIFLVLGDHEIAHVCRVKSLHEISCFYNVELIILEKLEIIFYLTLGNIFFLVLGS